MSTRTTTGTKAVVLVLATFVATMCVTACIVVIAIMGLVTLWKVIAGVFLASVAVVGVGAWRIVPGGAGRWATVGVYGVAMLASYVVVAFGLMVAFNC